MHPIRQLFALLILLAGLTAAQAETFHTCGTIIASVPTVITTQGVYCLNHDVNTAVTAGNAITINSSNVTLDCNGYKIGGLAAGTSSGAMGILAGNTRLNITVRNCGVRGFQEGIVLNGAGSLVEDNRLDNNLTIGIDVSGDNSRVQRNRVYDTGGYPSRDYSYGIYASADVIDNTVAGVFSTAADASAFGIYMGADGTEARGNQVRGLVVAGAGLAHGIVVHGHSVTLRGNAISVSVATIGWPIEGMGATDTFCIGNTAAKFTLAISLCQLGSDNLTN